MKCKNLDAVCGRAMRLSEITGTNGHPSTNVPLSSQLAHFRYKSVPFKRYCPSENFCAALYLFLRFCQFKMHIWHRNNYADMRRNERGIANCWFVNLNKLKQYKTHQNETMQKIYVNVYKFHCIHISLLQPWKLFDPHCKQCRTFTLTR